MVLRSRRRWRSHVWRPCVFLPGGSRAHPWLAEVDEHIRLVTFMHYDLGYFDDETCRLEPIDNPFGPKLLPMSPE